MQKGQSKIIRLIAFVLDGTGIGSPEPLKALNILENEIRNYKTEMLNKSALIV